MHMSCEMSTGCPLMCEGLWNKCNGSHAVNGGVVVHKDTHGCSSRCKTLNWQWRQQKSAIRRLQESTHRMLLTVISRYQGHASHLSWTWHAPLCGCPAGATPSPAPARLHAHTYRRSKFIFFRVKRLHARPHTHARTHTFACPGKAACTRHPHRHSSSIFF